MTLPPNDSPVTFRSQLDKIGRRGFLGSQIIMIEGIGQELGIFEYLFQKSKKQPIPGDKPSVSFSFEELREQLSLQPTYLDAWLQMAVDCGLFEVDVTCPRSLKTAPYIFELLINREDYTGQYVGFVMDAFYYLTSIQSFIRQAFKTGEVLPKSEVPIEIRNELQKNSARMGALVEQVFSMQCKKYQKLLREGGTLLEVGCGFGYNLDTWAKKYQDACIVGIDIDAEAIKSCQKRGKANNWGDRINLVHASTREYAQRYPKTFDVILLNHVLHELDPDENYRKSVFMDIYGLLKDDGLLIVADPMVPDLFAPQDNRSGNEWVNFWRTFAKWSEVAYGAKFCNKKSFQDLVVSTPFKHIELLQDAEHTIWALIK